MKLSFTKTAFFAFCLLTFSVSAARAQKTELTISAAASLKNALSQIAKDYSQKQPNVVLHFNFGASGTLQRQIEQGAPVDVFIAASEKNMDELVAQSLIDAATRRVIVSNRLVLVVPISSTGFSSTRNGANSIRSFRDLGRADVRHVAIGAPSSVPAGKYAQQVLTKIGIWNRVLPKAIQAKDVREVLTQVELGNVEAGIVYQSDAAISSQVRVVAIAPEATHKPIRYPAAVVRDSKNPLAARAFVNFLTSARSRAIFRNLKFVVK